MTPEEPRPDPSRRSLTDYVAEALAKIETEEGHAELERQHELVEAEAQRERLEALRSQDQDALEAKEDAMTPPEVRPESRLNPILPVVSVSEAPEREAGRLAFAGILDAGRQLPDAQLPLLPAPEGPRVPLLELVDRWGVPTMARG